MADAETLHATGGTVVIKDEPGTLLFRAPCAADDAWWKLYRNPPQRRFLAAFARSRAKREAIALTALAGAGIPAAHPLGWDEHRQGGCLHASLLVTRNEPGQDLRSLLRQPGTSEQRHTLLQAAGAAARQLHDAGFGHFRMQLRNLLAHGDPPQCAWLDAPYLLQWPNSAPRPVRSLDLVDLAGQDSQLTSEEAATLLAAYAQEDQAPLTFAQLRTRPRLAQKFRRIGYYLLGLATCRRP